MLLRCDCLLLLPVADQIDGAVPAYAAAFLECMEGTRGPNTTTKSSSSQLAVRAAVLRFQRQHTQVRPSLFFSTRQHSS
jgi:hypothetical protein